MNRTIRSLFLFLTFTANLSAFVSEQDWTSQLQSFYLLRDDGLAIEAADMAVQQYPRSLGIYVSAMRIYAHAGDETKMMQLLHIYSRQFPADSYPRNLLEEMAWGIIQKGARATTPMTRAVAIIAAALGNDAKGVDILEKHLEDPHRVIRLLSVEFASKFRDAKLQEAVLRRLGEEKDYEVKMALLVAAGAMHITETKPLLLRILENARTSADEKTSAIISLVTLYDTADRKEVERFVKHPQAALRVMAAALIRINERAEDTDLLIGLLSDSHAEVRKAALEALGDMQIDTVRNVPVLEHVRPLTQDMNSDVAITAAWALMLQAPDEGQAHLEPWLKSATAEERQYAAAALAGAGKYGFPLTLNAFQESEDDCVKVNLGLALIQQGIKPEWGAQALYQAVSLKNKKWMTKNLGRFMAITPCEVSHRADIPNYPEVISQTTRLELLNQLALLHHPLAQQAIQSFLQERPWGVSGAASALLLTEGDEEALGLIRNLLKDPSEKIRLQAALILGLWGADPEALSTLQALYPAVTRAKKEQILEALGHIGEHSALPFLVHCMEEPCPTLRIIAASAILQTLYH
jgi:HEAT repeat protein